MMKVPTKVPCQNGLMPSSVRLLRMISISAAPTTAPNAVPEPPIRLAPPMTTAAMTISSMPVPMPVVMVPSQPTCRMPAIPAISAREHVDADLDAAHRHAGHRRRLLVAADGEDVPAPSRPAEGEAEDQREHERGTTAGLGTLTMCRRASVESAAERGVRARPSRRAAEPAARRAAAEADELRVVAAEIEDHGVVRHHHGHAARERHHAERHHEGRHADIGDQHAADAAGEAARRRGRPAAPSRSNSPPPSSCR